MIPEFPIFIPLALEHREALEAYLHQHPPLMSEYTFTNLYAWQPIAGYAIARYGDGFLLCKEGVRGPALLQPLVSTAVEDAVRDGLAYLRTQTATPRIERVDEAFIQQADWTARGLTVCEDRDNFDYVYRVDELVELKGELFHDKKNLLNQFVKRQTYTYRPLTTELIAQGLALGHEWCEERECEKNAGLAQEQCAVHSMLTHFSALRATGGVIEIDGKLVALTLGEALTADTLVIHIEKAIGSYPGLYQAINWEYLRHAGAGFTYVNREQDLGAPGLRKAKLSYNPAFFVRKFVLEGCSIRGQTT